MIRSNGVFWLLASENVVLEIVDQFGYELYPHCDIVFLC